MGPIFVAILDFSSKRRDNNGSRTLTNFSDEVTEGCTTARVGEERIERSGWIAN